MSPQIIATVAGGLGMVVLRFGDILVKWTAKRLGVEENKQPTTPPPPP